MTVTVFTLKLEAIRRRVGRFSVINVAAKAPGQDSLSLGPETGTRARVPVTVTTVGSDRDSARRPGHRDCTRLTPPAAPGHWRPGPAGQAPSQAQSLGRSQWPSLTVTVTARSVLSHSHCDVTVTRPGPAGSQADPGQGRLGVSPL